MLVMIAAALNYLAEFSNSGLLAVRSIRIQPIILADLLHGHSDLIRYSRAEVWN